MLKWLKGNRTRIIGAIISILGLVEVYGREIVPESYQGWALFTAGVLMVILRQITTTPPGQRAPEPRDFNGEHVP